MATCTGITLNERECKTKLFTNNVRDYEHAFKPLKTKVEPKNWCFVDVAPFPMQESFSRSMLVFGRVMHVYPFSLSFTL